MFQLSSVLLSLFVSFTVSTAHADFVIAPDDQVLGEISVGGSAPLPNQLKVLTWNIEKGKAQAAWAQDFQKLMTGTSLALLQEGVEESFVVDTLRLIRDLSWVIARTFFMETDRKGTGVITGSSQQPYSLAFLRTRDTEPVINTPKMTLFSTYYLESGERILVMNIHAINFTTPGPFYRQIDDAVGVMKGWEGKILAAGDFNTWAQNRTEYLLKKMKELELEHVTFKNDPRGLVLDHVFIRGCSTVEAQIHSDIHSSDHFPLTTEFSCPN